MVFISVVSLILSTLPTFSKMKIPISLLIAKIGLKQQSLKQIRHKITHAQI